MKPIDIDSAMSDKDSTHSSEASTAEAAVESGLKDDPQNEREEHSHGGLARLGSIVHDDEDEEHEKADQRRSRMRSIWVVHAGDGQKMLGNNV